MKSPIKTFALRAGRMSPRQIRGFELGWPQFGLRAEDGTLNPEAVFQRNADTILEIGFGMGHSFFQMAKANPDKNFVGIEVHRPGVGALCADLLEAGLTNVRIYNQDAVQIVQECILDDCLSGIQIFFPDPWPKSRHHKRRLVQTPFIQLIVPKLKPGGFIHLATDWQNYAEQMLEVLSAEKSLKNRAGNGFFTNPTERPLTKFENRGLKLGHGIWDLVFEKHSIE